jgi:AcrR family transcriptional regulator
MSVQISEGRVAQRRDRTRREILAAAWDLADERGFDGLSLRDLAERVGMRAPSLYSYFDSKAAILDALFAEGHRAVGDEVQAALASLPEDLPAAETLARGLQAWLHACQANPARYRLLYTTAVPGWRPSEDAYAVSIAEFARMTDHLSDIGVTDPRHIDLYTAVASGLAAQQMANDPDGDRWVSLVREAADLLITATATPGGSRP